MYQLRQMKFFLLFTTFGVVLSASEYLIKDNNNNKNKNNLQQLSYLYLTFAAINYIVSRSIKIVSGRLAIFFKLP